MSNPDSTTFPTETSVFGLPTTPEVTPEILEAVAEYMFDTHNEPHVTRTLHAVATGMRSAA